MTTPPQGNNPHSAGGAPGDAYDEYGRPLHQQAAVTGEMADIPPARPPQLRGLSQEMADRNRGAGPSKKERKRQAKEEARRQQQGNGWFRNPFARQGGAPEAPANPWVTAARQTAPPRTGLGAGQAEAPAPEPAPQPRGKGRPARAEEDEEPQGNGWFQNPFAKPKPAGGGARSGSGSSTGRRPGAQVSGAQMWAGPRRGILVRRMLGVLAVVLLLIITVNVNRKVNRATVDAMISEKVKTTGVAFPGGDAVMWAAPLVKAFTTYSEKSADDRKLALAPYAVNGLDDQLGWNGSGTQSAIDLVMSPDVQVIARDRAIVNATVQIQDGSWRCVSVPVFTRTQGHARAFGLLANPVYRSCSGLTTPPQPAQGDAQNDSALAEKLQNDLLPLYLAAWAHGDQQSLGRYLLPGTRSFGLGGAFTGAGNDGRPQVDDVYVPTPTPQEDPDKRVVTFTVVFQGIDGKSQQTSTYQLPIAKQGSQWYVTADPTPAVDASSNGGATLPSSAPTSGSGDMYSGSPAPYPSNSAGGSGSPSGSPSQSPGASPNGSASPDPGANGG